MVDHFDFIYFAFAWNINFNWNSTLKGTPLPKLRFTILVSRKISRICLHACMTKQLMHTISTENHITFHVNVCACISVFVVLAFLVHST